MNSTPSQLGSCVSGALWKASGQNVPFVLRDNCPSLSASPRAHSSPFYDQGAGANLLQPKPECRGGTLGIDAGYRVGTARSTGECLRDLLDLSARLLRLGGRMVYFLPAAPEAYSEAEVPAHPALAAVANCEQVLNARYSRRLITMRKARSHARAKPDQTDATHLFGEPCRAMCRQQLCCLVAQQEVHCAPDHVAGRTRMLCDFAMPC